MEGKDFWQEVKCFGSVTVGPRGQVVIPANVRRDLDIVAGATMLVFVGPGKRGLLLLKAESLEQLVSVASERLADIERTLKEAQPKSR